MRKSKYKFSEEGIERLMESFDTILNRDSEKFTGLSTAEITTDFVKLMTKVKDIDDVVSRNNQLTKRYIGFLNMYGFESMHDMYTYAMSCDSHSIQKGKDYSKLVPVKRKIMRNGKETEVTVWENPNKDQKDENDSTEGSNNGKKRHSNVRHARDHKKSIVGESKPPTSKEVADLKLSAKKMPNGNKPFQDGSKYYLEIRGDDGDVIGIVGYLEEDRYLTMDFYRSNGEVSGVAATGFFQLILLASRKNKGVKMNDQPEARSLFMQSGLERNKDGYWVIEADSLKSIFGESGYNSG